jgi:predicted DNA-binding transcriptional regulator YafY
MAYKHDYDKTLTRLNTIIARLNNGEALSVGELADEFNVSTRTIQRDFNERLVNLYPIYQDKKLWKMQDGYKIEKSTSIEDTIVLDILEKLTDSLGSKFSIKAKHLLSKIKNESFNPIYAKLNMEDISSKISDIALLEDAIKDKREITCIYKFIKDKKECKKKFELKPLKIANFEGFWYLIAFDARNDKLKKYHLKSISSIKIETKKFKTTKKIEEPLEDSVNIWFESNVEPFEVILWLDDLAAKILKRKPISKSQRIIQEYEDGSCDIALKITHKNEITSIVKYWIPHINIIEPKFIRDSVMKDVKKYIEQNQI